jgi:hypothetical protein
MDHAMWSLLKDMAMVKRSLAGVDEFVDIDTQNRFYRWRDESEEIARLAAEEDAGIAKSAEQLLLDMDLALKYSFTAPEQFVFAEKVNEAIHYVRIRTDEIRTVNDFECRYDGRNADEVILYVSDSVAESGGIGVTTLVPTQLGWDALQAHAVSIGTLGAADEWNIYQLHDGQEFYVKKALNDYRWTRPVDAVEKSDAEVSCAEPSVNRTMVPRRASRRGLENAESVTTLRPRRHEHHLRLQGRFTALVHVRGVQHGAPEPGQEGPAHDLRALREKVPREP